MKTRVYAAQPWAGWPRQADGAGGWREEGQPGHGRGHASAVGRDSDGKMTVGGTTRLVGDTQEGCCTPREEAGPPGRSCVRGTTGRAEDDCDDHRHLGTDGTKACSARPGHDGGQKGDTGPMGQMPISPPVPMQCGCWRKTGQGICPGQVLPETASYEVASGAPLRHSSPLPAGSTATPLHRKPARGTSAWPPLLRRAAPFPPQPGKASPEGSEQSLTRAWNLLHLLTDPNVQTNTQSSQPQGTGSLRGFPTKPLWIVLNVQTPQPAAPGGGALGCSIRAPHPASRPWMWPRGPGSMSPTTRGCCRAVSSSACEHGRASRRVSPVHCEQEAKTRLSAPRRS